MRALFLLKKLSRALQSDVLADGAVSAKYGIPTSRHASLGNISLKQETLLRAFRQALSGQKVDPLLDDDDKRVKVTVSIEDNGTAILKLGKAGFAFTHAGLLSPDAKTRLGYLERYVQERRLAKKYADKLRVKVGDEALSDDEFLKVVETLLTAPDHFAQTLKSKIKAGGLTNSDLLPDEARYWDNLIAPLDKSKSLEEFMRVEYDNERDTLIKEDAVRAFFVLSVSFCAPELVPIEKFRSTNTASLLDAMERAAKLADHFAVTGAFEICADWFSRDSRFEARGITILDQLFGNMEQLQERCAFFAGIFALTSARLAQHEILRRKPAFWRRITAAAHASLVVRICGPDNAQEMYAWALGHFGKPFVFSVSLEANEEPRWKPDWLTPKHLIADAFGRVEAALNKIPEAERPKAWVERLAKAEEWMVAQNAELLRMFPAIGQSARRKRPTEEETFGFQPFLQKLYLEPSLDNFIMSTPAFYTVGVTDNALKASQAVMAHLQKDEAHWKEEMTPRVVQTLAYVVMQTRDSGLADFLAEFCVGKTRELTDEDSTVEIVCRLVECASAFSDHAKAMDVLAERLERVAFLAPASSSGDLHDSLRYLQILNDELFERLGKALAVSRMGRKAA